MTAKTRIQIIAVATIVLLAAGCAERRETYARNTTTQTQNSVVSEAPPEAQVEVVGNPPGPDYVWAPGYWEWDGRWVWVSGRWVLTPRPHAVWVPGHWRRTSQGWVWIHGYWR